MTSPVNGLGSKAEAHGNTLTKTRARRQQTQNPGSAAAEHGGSPAAAKDRPEQGQPPRGAATRAAAERGGSTTAAKGRPEQGQPPRGAGTRAAAERGGSTTAAKGRPEQGQPPRGAATRAAAERGGSSFVDNYLGYLLGQANHALFKDFDEAVRAAGLGSLEWRVLAALSEQAPIAIGHLAQEVLSQQPTVTKLVQRLAASGWVRLADDPDDQRRTLVQITAAGQRKVNPLIAQALEHESHALSGLNATEIQRLKAQLRQLARQPR